MENVLSLEEQAKITACLESIDALIDNQAQKLELLKSYKKGLMKQMLHIPGQSLPELRFPEFKPDQQS